MWNYHTPVRPDELCHWGASSGDKIKGSKYYQRITTGVNKRGQNIYRYFYSAAEWRAYNDKQTVGSKPVHDKKAAESKGADWKKIYYENKAKRAELEAKNEEKKAHRQEKRSNTARVISDLYDHAASSHSEKKDKWSEKGAKNKYLEDGYKKRSEHEKDMEYVSKRRSNTFRIVSDILKRASINDKYKAEKLSRKAEESKKKAESYINGTVGSQPISGVALPKDFADKIRGIASKLGEKIADKIETKLAKGEDKESRNFDKPLEEKKNVNPEADRYDNTLSLDQIKDNTIVPLNNEVNTFMDESKDSKELEQKLRDAGYLNEGETASQYLERYGLLDETAEGMHPSSFDDLKRQNGSNLSDMEQMFQVNQNNLLTNEDSYGSYAQYGYSNNCAYCTLAYDLRQRGYDVEASAVSYNTANTLDVIESWYEGGKFTKVKAYQSASKEILKNNPEGSRGQLCVFWTGGGGHSVSYEVKNGEVIVKDAQIGKEYKYDDWAKARNISQINYMRTDDKEPTEKALVGVKNRNTSGKSGVNFKERKTRV